MERTRSIELLNKALQDELTAVHQYMYFHFRLNDLGYDLLSGMFKRVSITEMMHCEKLAERILFLKGEVELFAGKVDKIHEVKEMIKKACEMESGSVRDYNIWAKECSDNFDSGTKKIFEGLVEEEEQHYDMFQTEMDNLEKFKENYLALQSIERSKMASTGMPATK